MKSHSAGRKFGAQVGLSCLGIVRKQSSERAATSGKFLPLSAWWTLLQTQADTRYGFIPQPEPLSMVSILPRERQILFGESKTLMPLICRMLWISLKYAAVLTKPIITKRLLALLSIRDRMVWVMKSASWT